jgi:uncharacterized membrane protein YqjE
MALLQALISLLGRSVGKIVRAVFGWAVVALFGRSSQKEQTLLSGVVAMAALWPLLLIGIAFPRVAAFIVAFIPVGRSAPDSVLRVIWLALAVVVPLIVGLVVAAKRPPGTEAEPFLMRLVRGYPVTLALAGAFLVLFIMTPVLKIASAVRGRSDEHVPLITEGDEYQQASHVIDWLIARHDLGASRARPPWWMELPSRILEKIGGKAFAAYMPEDFAYWHGERLQIALYPSDVLVRGTKKTAAWTHGLIAEAFARGPGLQTTDVEAQRIERQTQRVWKVLDGTPESHIGSPILLGRVIEMSRELGKLEIPYDEWQIAYRKIAQLGRALRGEPQLLEQAAAAEGKGGGVMAHAPSPQNRGERPLQSAPTGELLGELFRQSSELLKKEIELARAEIRETTKAAVQVTIGTVVAAMLGMLALAAFCASAVLALANTMEPWTASLIVGVVLLVIAGITMLSVRSKTKKAPLERTQRTVKEDVQWAKERIA